MVEDNKGMINTGVDYYNKLFSREDNLDIDLCNDFWGDGDMVSHDQRSARC
jgi:hypothetical protein